MHLVLVLRYRNAYKKRSGGDRYEFAVRVVRGPTHLNAGCVLLLVRKQGFELTIAESGRPTELMRGGNLPLFETWERIRTMDPSMGRLFYQLGFGRTRETIFRLR